MRAPVPSLGKERWESLAFARAPSHDKMSYGRTLFDCWDSIPTIIRVMPKAFCKCVLRYVRVCGALESKKHLMSLRVACDCLHGMRKSIVLIDLIIDRRRYSRVQAIIDRLDWTLNVPLEEGILHLLPVSRGVNTQVPSCIFPWKRQLHECHR